jgi:hypothetical protein
MQVLALDRHTNVAGLNQLMGPQPSPPETGISSGSHCLYIFVLFRLTMPLYYRFHDFDLVFDI